MNASPQPDSTLRSAPAGADGWTGPPPVPPAEPSLTARELIARATALRPRLQAEQAATEQRTYYSAEIHQAFIDAGFYKTYVPRRFGGYEFDFPTFSRLVIELGKGCPSTAWCFALGASHVLQLTSWFSEQAQFDMLSKGQFFCMASAGQPVGVAKRIADGWEINGKASYCSGIPYSTHYMGQALMAAPDGKGPPPVMLFIIPKQAFTILDDWGEIIGLKGSGSHSIEIRNARIPRHWVLENSFVMDHDVSGGTPGYRLHRNPLYAGRGAGTFIGTIASVTVGMAYGALEEYRKLMETKPIGVPPFGPRRTDPDFQRWHGEAIARIATAEAALLGMADKHVEACNRAVHAGEEFTYGKDILHSAIAREVMLQCWDVMQSVIWRTAGSSAGKRGERLERIYRDMSTANGHRSTGLREFFFREVAQTDLGLR